MDTVTANQNVPIFYLFSYFEILDHKSFASDRIGTENITNKHHEV